MQTTRERLDDRRWNVSTYRSVIRDGTKPVKDVQVPISHWGSWSRIRDNNNRTFRTVQKMGGVILSDMLLERFERSFVDGNIYTSNGAYQDSLTGDLAHFVELQSSVASVGSISLPQIVLAQAYERMNKSAVMSGETLGELNQVVAMLRSPFKSAFDLIREIDTKVVRCRKARATRNIAQAITGIWLEKRYGWDPIFSDIFKIAEKACDIRAQIGKERLVARAGKTLTSTMSGHIGPVPLPLGMESISGSYSSDASLKCSAGVIYSVKPMNATEQLMSILGVRPRDIPSVAWNLAPWSFVADWFTNVGSWLEAVTPVPGIFVHGNWITNVSVTTQTCSASVAYAFDPPPSLRVGSYGSSSRKWTTVSRECGVQLSFTPVMRDGKLSPLNSVDAGMLSIQQLIAAINRCKA